MAGTGAACIATPAALSPLALLQRPTPRDRRAPGLLRFCHRLASARRVTASALQSDGNVLYAAWGAATRIRWKNAWPHLASVDARCSHSARNECEHMEP